MLPLQLRTVRRRNAAARWATQQSLANRQSAAPPQRHAALPAQSLQCRQLQFQSINCCHHRRRHLPPLLAAIRFTLANLICYRTAFATFTFALRSHQPPFAAMPPPLPPLLPLQHCDNRCYTAMSLPLAARRWRGVVAGWARDRLSLICAAVRCRLQAIGHADIVATDMRAGPTRTE